MRHPYADFLTRVQKPTRYLGGEYNEVRKPIAGLRARVCLAFPDVYEIGMSHLGTKILYAVLNRTPGIACERAFAPWIDMESELRARGLPVLTLESASPLRDFDVVGFSLQYELTYTNVLNLLDLSGLPLRASERGDEGPLILAGGPTATHPEPLAPFIDAFFIGEAEELLPPLVLEAAELRRNGVPRRERLCRLAERYPLYVPELYSLARDPDTGLVVVGEPLDARVPSRPRRTWVADINRFPFPDDSPLPYSEAIFDRMAVEISRGCTEGCRFCQAGMIYRPVRERDPVSVLESLVGGVRRGGYDETALTSLSTADYSCVTPLVKAAMARLRDEKVALSVSSLRAYGLNEDLLGDMATMRAQGLTFAPEAGTQRMRDVITKNVTEEDILESARRVFGHGFQRMKLYFMIGLPTEEDEDVRGIVETAWRVQETGRRHLRSAQVTASVSTHVPKPHTPFQWAAMDPEPETARKQGLLAELARQRRVGLKTHDNYQSHLEGIFSRGDRDVAHLLETAFRLGCRFDGWDDVLRTDLWDRALDEARTHAGLRVERYLGTIPVSSRLPWDHIEIGLEPGFLLAEYRKALKDRLSPPCGKPYKKLLHPASVPEALADAGRKLVCYDCGIACDLDAMKAERIFFLKRMSAWTHPPQLASGTHDAILRGTTGDASPRPPRPVTRIEQGEGHRHRFRYTKRGRAAYLGHLDLVRHLPRIFRRAGLELTYSLGFHPKPELGFGPALGLGIASLAELLDVKLSERPPVHELLERLREATLDGIDFLAAVSLAEGDRALSRVVDEAELVASLPPDANLALAQKRFEASGPLLVRRASDRGIGRTIDVRRSLIGVEAIEDDALRQKLGWPEWPLLRVRLALGPEGHARPAEVIEAVLGPEAAAQALWVRTALRAGGSDPLDLEALRGRRAQRDVAADAGRAAPTSP